MIPKKIHYCWFGGEPFPQSVLRCMESWRTFCPDYEIIEWNERNFDINACAYTQEAYQAGKWAFVSDVARLHALVKEGGIYLDTDMELLKPLDQFLSYEAAAGLESDGVVALGFLSCCQEHPLILELLNSYRMAHFINPDSTYDQTTIVQRFTELCRNYGLKEDNCFQSVAGMAVFPIDYFYPKDYRSGILKLSENSCSIHHYDSSWLSAAEKYAFRVERRLRKYLPEKTASRAAKFVSIVKYYGFLQALRATVKWLERRGGTGK